MDLSGEVDRLPDEAIKMWSISGSSRELDRQQNKRVFSIILVMKATIRKLKKESRDLLERASCSSVDMMPSRQRPERSRSPRRGSSPIRPPGSTTGFSTHVGRSSGFAGVASSSVSLGPGFSYTGLVPETSYRPFLEPETVYHPSLELFPKSEPMQNSPEVGQDFFESLFAPTWGVQSSRGGFSGGGDA